MHSPMTQPIIIESRRLLDLIMDIRLLIPGIVPVTGDCRLQNTIHEDENSPITPVIRVLIEVSEERCRPNSARVS